MKYYRRLFLTFTVILSCLCLMFAAVACSGGECKHEWTEATCTAPKTCSVCGETEGDALGHTGGTATCEHKAECARCGEEYGEFGAHVPKADDGDCTTAIICSVCGDVTTPAETSHTGGTATCEHKAKCERCGKEYGEFGAHVPKADDGDCTTEIICSVCGDVTTPAETSHTGGTATCEHKAKCERCGKEYGEFGAHVPKADDGDCTTAIICSVCGDVTTPAETSHTGGTATCEHKAKCERCGKEYGEFGAHKWKEATCIAPKTCLDCGATEGEPLGHDWVEKEVLEVADCEKNGLIEYECSKCHKTKEEIVNALGHEFDNQTIKPTCTTKGYDLHNCTRENCGYSYSDNEISALGHDWDKDRTCTEGQKCKRCTATTLPLGHKYKEIESTKADCINPATKTYQCERCQDSYTEIIGTALGHDIANAEFLKNRLVEGTTCEYVQVYLCNLCGTEVDSEEHIEIHNYMSKITQEATCVSTGEKTYSCVCGKSYTEIIEINENGHIWDKGSVSEGIITYTCINDGCGKTKTAVDASGQTNADVDKTQLQDNSLKLETAEISLDQNTIDGIQGDGALSIGANTLEGEDRDAALSQLNDEKIQQLGDNPIYSFTMQQNG